MEPLSETEWDVVISGTGIQQSLLALALSRSDKKVLHVDLNDYYGGAEAAFSLQEAEEWVGKVNSNVLQGPFSKAFVRKTADDGVDSASGKLSFSRAYTLTLSPQIIYSRSKLLSQLVSSKVYRQLEFQAVGNWWILDSEADQKVHSSQGNRTPGVLKRVPNGREDVFSDNSIDVRAKRSLMKFLKFVVDFENQIEIWQPYAGRSLAELLSDSFNLSPPLQTVLLALTLSLDLPARTTVEYSLPRIARHLTSIGVFGPGFGAVIPKWGGSSEIAQVACRAGAVGGAVYILDAGIKASASHELSHIAITLTNGEAIRTKCLVESSDSITGSMDPNFNSVSRMISIVSSDLESLFATTVEGGPTAAVSVVAFPSGSVMVDGQVQPQPIYIMVHSSDTGECPAGQYILYASTSTAGNPEARLQSAISMLLACSPLPEPSETVVDSVKTQAQTKILYQVYYEQTAGPPGNSHSGNTCSLAASPVDLAFDDALLENVEDAWKTVMRLSQSDEASQTASLGSYMVFEEREQMGVEEEDYDGM